MIWVDYVIISIIVFSSIISLIRGFVCDALSLVTWVCAFFVARHYYNNIAIYFTNFEEQIVRNSIAIAMLFVSILIVGAIVNYAITSLVKLTGLSSIDRVLGICFGAMKGILIVSAVLFTLDTFTDFSHCQDWQESRMIPQFSGIIKLIFNYLRNKSSFL
ncbi:CvpA family protein [Sodalis endosymbiont of Henestaris halophilus]|uniref:CvpA family protein n=1 Tax=Sodalis endosymbiont of Henestaris halophilus TaxID=1929246 RepID=UPI000BBFF727|nr:CvpA family protein [Sodalis endosymbiont of Henestaris halophilus]SNC58851.1 Colicin V production protein [Sodalis endosymbiont of Henestaris halophilus]